MKPKKTQNEEVAEGDASTHNGYSADGDEKMEVGSDDVKTRTSNVQKVKKEEIIAQASNVIFFSRIEFVKNYTFRKRNLACSCVPMRAGGARSILVNGKSLSLTHL